MKLRQMILALTVIGALVGCGEQQVQEEAEPLVEGEPAELVAELIAAVSDAVPEDRTAIYAEWAEANRYQLFPVMESSTVTFVYYHTNEEPVEQITLAWELNNFDRTAIPLHRVEDSELFYISLVMDDPVGVEYGFVQLEAGETRGDFISDPLNGNINYGLAIRSVIEDYDSENGYLQYIKNVQPESEFYELKKRDVHVYLPPDYYTDTNKTYAVLYMQDGQNVWESDQANFGGWKMDTIASEMSLSGEIEPIIIVGIENPGDYYLRAGEYIGFSYGYKELSNGYTNLGEDYTNMSLAYEDFVIHQVIPMIESRYRVKTGPENTGIAGSSFGAGASLFLGFRNPDVFSKIAALSGGDYSGSETTLKIKPFWVFDYLIGEVVYPDSGLKVYIDCGDRDIDKIFMDRTTDMYVALTNMGYVEGDNLYYLIEEGKGHNEKSWAGRAPLFLEFLFEPAEDE